MTGDIAEEHIYLSIYPHLIIQHAFQARQAWMSQILAEFDFRFLFVQ